MKNSKRILSLFLALCMVMALFSSLTFTANADTADKNGMSGDVTWGLYGTKLEISGQGDMADYKAGAAPWGMDITEVTIYKGVTHIGSNAFWGCTKLNKVTIPTEYSISIADQAFYNCSSLENITLPDNVTSIGFYALNKTAYYQNLSNWENGVLYNGNHLIEANDNNTGSYTIKAGTLSVADYAFSKCEKIESIAIPSSVTRIGVRSFQYCKSLESIIIPDGVTSIGQNAFYDTAYYNNSENWENGVLYIGKHLIKADHNKTDSKKLPTDYAIKDGTLTVADNAFINRTTVESITIPNTVTHIGNYAFYNCSELESITVPNTVTSIGYDAFSKTAYYNNSENWENGVLYIGKCLIEADSKTLPADYSIKDGTVTIVRDAFDGCTNLKSITIPNTVTSIEDWAFDCCKSLESLTIPNSVTSIGCRALFGCIGLNSITVQKGNPVYHSSGNCIIETATKTLVLGCKNSVIPSDGSVTSIGEYALCLCPIKSITIPKSITSIGYDALTGCYDLTSITVEKGNPVYHSSGNCLIETKSKTLIQGCNNSVIPTDGSVTTIGEAAFYGCESLEIIKIPSSVTSIEDWAFYDCIKIKSIGIPSSVTNIGYYAFYYCSEELEIIGTAGSYAENYANTIGFKFTACQHTDTYINGKKAATCTQKGYTGDTKCAKCDEPISKGTSVAALGHKYKTTTTKATFSKNGKIVKACKTCGKVASTTTIYKVSSVKLSATSYVYNGKAKKPTVTVKTSNGKTLKNGTDYTLSYSNNKNVGKASVKVTLKGNYSGSKTLTFKINPKSTALKNLTAGKKQITAKWNKQATQTTGYQIQYSTSSAFKNAKTVTVTSNKTTSKTVKNLTGGKKYYARVRTYKTVKNTKYYSAWSAKKSATAKKK